MYHIVMHTCVYAWRIAVIVNCMLLVWYEKQFTYAIYVRKLLGILSRISLAVDVGNWLTLIIR